MKMKRVEGRIRRAYKAVGEEEEKWNEGMTLWEEGRSNAGKQGERGRLKI